jgi:uncharacterized protein (TIGR02453 family)
MADHPPPPFGGFAPDGLAFLRELAEHQDRVWFQANRARYETGLQAPMTSLVAALATELARRGVPLRGDAKRSLFRIHRDVRFSPDKRPYKTNIGALLSRDGDKDSPGVLYVHIGAAGSFTAAGFYRPEPPFLGALRERIVAKPDAWRSTLNRLAASGLALDEDEDALKRLPRGFESVGDPALADALRRRSFIVRRPLAATEVTQPGLVERLAEFAEAASPLLAFGWV